MFWLLLAIGLSGLGEFLALRAAELAFVLRGYQVEL